MAGVKVWEELDVLTAADVMEFLMGQAVPRFADTSERDDQMPDPEAGQLCYVDSVGLLVYNGGWIAVAAVASVAGRTGAVVLTKADVGLSNVDNTSDANKPVSTAQAAADALKVAKAGDTMTGQLDINFNGALKVRNGASDGFYFEQYDTNGWQLRPITAAGSVFRVASEVRTTDRPIVANYDSATARAAIGPVGPGSAGGLLIGGDSNLYRSAAAQLRTNSELRVDYALYAAFNQGTNVYCGLGGIGPSGKGALTIGNDISLYRDAADVLKTDDALDVASLRIAGQGTGLWQDFTPTLASGWAVGDGTIEARYIQVGKLIHWYVAIAFGSTSTYGGGQFTVTLPVTRRNSVGIYGTGGHAVGYQHAVNTYHWALLYNGSTAGVEIIGANGAAGNVTGTAPWTWAATDTIFLTGSYEAA